MFQSPEGTAALLSATGEFAVSDQRLSAAAAARVRRSVRRYSSEPVTDQQVHTLIELTGRAPSAFNAQPWRFIVVRDQALKDQLMGCLLYTSPSPRDRTRSRMPSSA